MAHRRLIASRRRKRISKNRVDMARNRPKVVIPPDIDGFPTIPFPESKSKEKFRCDIYENQGTRVYMEDMNDLVLEEDHCFFAVYDGHGGRSVPRHVKTHLYGRVRENMKNGGFENPEEAIKDSFIKLEDELFVKSRKKFNLQTKEGEEENENKEEEERISGGSCATVLYINEDYDCVCANVGDCKMLVYDKNGEFEEMTVTHDTNSEEEYKRITEDLGIRFRKGGRVGGLKITRSFGDFFRPKGKKVICADPSIKTFKLDTKRHHSIVIASDGLWGNMDEEEVYNEIRNEVDPRISTRKLMRFVCEKLTDNITICVIHVHEPISEETKKKAEMVKKGIGNKYSNEEMIKKTQEYVKEREEDCNAPSAYARLKMNDKKED